VFEAISKKCGGFSRFYEDLTRNWLNTVISGAQGILARGSRNKIRTVVKFILGFTEVKMKHHTNSYETPWVLDVAEIGDGQTCVMMGSPITKPRVCILGGGFGGLYTALRLESLVWPDDKRPQQSNVLILLVPSPSHSTQKTRGDDYEEKGQIS
ncbi:hypothetical protein RJ640_024077, partial [Escallonia rubra]